MEGEKRRGYHPLLVGGRRKEGGEGYTHGLSTCQMRSLSAVCEAFIPPLKEEDFPSSNGREDPPSKPVRAFFQASCSEPPLPDEVADLLVRRLDPKGVFLIRWVLWLLCTRLGTLLLCGSHCLYWRFPFIQSFPDMPLERREEVLKRWTRENFWIPLRMVFLIVKIFCSFVFFTLTDEKMQNPSWKAIGYTTPHEEEEQKQQSSPPPPKERPLDKGIIETKDETNSSLLSSLSAKGLSVSDAPDRITVHCDAVVIGSGCGGGVAAAVLAGSGHKVLVLEKGNYFTAGNYSSLEGPAMEHLYEGGGLLSSANGLMMLLAGSTVGGGSAVNWSACIKTPVHVMKEWSKVYNLPLFGSLEYTSAMETVWRRIGVTEACNEEDFENKILRRGCESLGVNVQHVARNSSEGHFCGHCGYGCRTADKGSTDTTWLVDAVGSGAVILTGCCAERLLLESNHGDSKQHKRSKRCIGVMAKGSGGVTKRIEIRAKATISACGSLKTPPLLLSSGLRNKNIGRNLRLHPVMLIWGHFPESTNNPEIKGRKTDGGIITSLHKVMGSEEPGCSADQRAIIETPLVGPGAFAALLPWVSGHDFKERMVKYSRTAHLFALVRDQGSGSVDANGVVKYRIDKRDEENLREGARRALQILVAAGATEVGTHRSDGQRVRCKAVRERDVEEFLDEVEVAGGPGSRGEVWSLYCSAHQMGSCRMGASAEEGAVDGNGESWEAEGLFVCDASMLPDAVGVNPMITIEAVAYCISNRIARFLISKQMI